jgi:TetR/AcrR family transcriptional regulator, tetracycline repressor protein
VAPRKSIDGLSRDAVVDRAMTLADVEGLDAVTIRRLGLEFGVTPMALYWHVKNKDELLDAMGDELYAGLRLPTEADSPWYEQLREVVAELVASLRRHPGSLSLAYRRVVTSEPGLALTEHTLDLLRLAGFSVRQSAELATSALQTAIMLVGSEPGAEQGVPEDEVGARLDAKRAALNELPIDRYPRIREAADDMLHCDDPEAYYESGVALFVEGARAMLQLARV